MKNNSYLSHIDTIETIELPSNRESIDTNIRGAESYSKKDGRVVTKYNPNNSSFCYKENESLTETEGTLKNMMKALTVISIDDVSYKRIDIATDITAPFEEIAKFLHLVHKCIRANYNGKEWHNIDDSDAKVSNYIFRSREIEIEFYNKHKQSNGLSKYATRLEIRFLRISSKNLKLHVSNSIKLWKDMPNNLDLVENSIIELLKSLLEEEQRARKIANFTEFVCRYQELIFTRGILEELYRYSNLKGSFKSWLQEYRNNHNIVFYTKTELVSFSKDVVRSLKNYLKRTV